jgi:hypothetical protein
MTFNHNGWTLLITSSSKITSYGVPVKWILSKSYVYKGASGIWAHGQALAQIAKFVPTLFHLHTLHFANEVGQDCHSDKINSMHKGNQKINNEYNSIQKL